MKAPGEEFWKTDRRKSVINQPIESASSQNIYGTKLDGTPMQQTDNQHAKKHPPIIQTQFISDQEISTSGEFHKKSDCCKTVSSHRILSIGCFESLCRQSLEINPNKSCLALQIALEASTIHGWFPARTIVGSIRNTCHVFNFRAGLCGWLIRKGILEHSMTKTMGVGQIKHYLRVADSTETTELDTIDGKHMLRIKDEFNMFANRHRMAPPSIGLVLTALYVRKIHSSAEMTRFIWPKGDKHTYSFRILHKLEELGLVGLMKKKGVGNGEKLFVYPLD